MQKVLRLGGFFSRQAVIHHNVSMPIQVKGEWQKALGHQAARQ